MAGRSDSPSSGQAGATAAPGSEAAAGAVGAPGDVGAFGFVSVPGAALGGMSGPCQNRSTSAAAVAS